MSEKHPDQRYLEGLAQNDYQILEEIDQRYRGILTNWVRNNSGNTEDAEDLFTETLLAIFDRLQKPKPLILTRPFSAYFMGVAKNKWYEQLRKRKKEERVRNDQVQQYIDESDESIEEELIQIEAASERFQRLEKTFVQLSELCQQLIDLFFNRGLTTSEIVARLNFNSEDTYYVRKKKCLDRWRTLLGES